MIAIARAPEHATVEIRGRVGAAEPLRAPFSRRECVYYRVEVNQLTWYEHRQWTLADRTDFTVDDGTGRATVIAERFAFNIVADYVALERASHLSPQILAVLHQHSCRLAELAQVEILEEALELGDTIDIVGRGAREPDPIPRGGERTYRDPQPTVLVFSADGLAVGQQREPRWLRPPWR